MAKLTYEVVIAAYNAENYLAEAIQSVVKSSVKPERIWVVDDASTDRTLDIARQFALVEVLRNETNRERSYSRNIAIERCSANFVQILDADDLIHPDKVAQQLDYFESYADADVAFGDVQTFTGTFTKEHFGDLRTYDDVDVLEQLIRKNTFAVHSMLFRRDYFNKYGFFKEDLPISEDRELYMRGLLGGAKFIYTPNALCYYRMHEGGTVISRQLEAAYYNALPVRMHRDALVKFKNGKYRSVTGESLRTLARNANIHKRPYQEVLEILNEANACKPYPPLQQKTLYRWIESLAGPAFLERLLRLKF